MFSVALWCLGLVVPLRQGALSLDGDLQGLVLFLPIGAPWPSAPHPGLTRCPGSLCLPPAVLGWRPVSSLCLGGQVAVSSLCLGGQAAAWQADHFHWPVQEAGPQKRYLC